MAHGNELLKKKFFYLKLPRDWFGNARIKKLRKLAGGDTYTIIYLKLLILSINYECRYIYEGLEKTVEEEIALKIDEGIEDVKLTLRFLEANGLWLSCEEADTYFLPEATGMAGSETYGNILRKGRVLGLANCKPSANQTLTIENKEIDKKIELESKKYIEFNKLTYEAVKPVLCEKLEISDETINNFIKKISFKQFGDNGLKIYCQDMEVFCIIERRKHDIEAVLKDFTNLEVDIHLCDKDGKELSDDDLPF